MVLADWYIANSMDSLVRSDSVWVPYFDSVNRSGYYLGSKNQKLIRTDAFAKPIPVNQTVDPALAFPLELVRNWYALPGYTAANYHGGRIQFKFNYVGARHILHTNLDGTKQIVVTSSSDNGLTAPLNSPLDSGSHSLNRCLDSLGPTDTLWIRSRGLESNYASRVDCFNHNPFWLERGTIWFAPPFPVRNLVVEENGMRVPMRSSSKFPGWYSAARLDSASSGVQQVRLRFQGQGSSGDMHIWDSSGVPWTVGLDSGVSVWMTASGKASNQDPDFTHPVVWIGFPSGCRLVLGSGSKGFAGGPVLEGWTGIALWNRPDSVWLLDAAGSRSKAIRIPATGDSVWLLSDSVTQRPVAPSIDSMRLIARAFDYDGSYNPFAGVGPDDNCPASGGKETRGLVKDVLDSAGLPVWTGKVACDIGRAADGPGNWFKPGYALLDTTVAITLRKSSTPGTWNFSNSSFFPLDNASSHPQSGPNLGFCLHFEFETAVFSGARLEIVGEDDIWVFADRKLALDMGGQHPPTKGGIDLSRQGMPNGGILPIDLFQCERHPVGSSFSISTNAVLVPKGSLREPQEPTSGAIHAGRKASALEISPNRLRIRVPSGEGWSVDVRSLDGRVSFRQSGSGAVELALPGVRGVVVANLRRGGNVENKTFFVR